MANTINFFGPVVEDQFEAELFDGITLKSFESDLKEFDGQDIEILMNSPGGDVFSGVAIANLIAQRQGKTTITVIGLAASIAADISMSADVLQIAENSMLMIHDSLSGIWGNAQELRKRARLLEKIDGIQANIMTNRVEENGKLIDGDRDKTKDKIQRMLDAETWLTASEAVDFGLADKMVKSRKEQTGFIEVSAGPKTDTMRARFTACLRSYKNTPTNILSKYDTKPMEKDKKSLWQSIKAFFAPELKAEIEAAQEPETKEEEPTTTENENNEEMTIEEMKAALLKEGFEVSEKQPEKVEEKAEETTDINAELLAELKAMKEKQSKLEAQLKDAQFAKAGKSAAGKGEEKETEKGPNVGAQNKAAFASLAALITE